MEGDSPRRPGAQGADDERSLVQRASHAQHLLQNTTIIHLIEKDDGWVQPAVGGGRRGKGLHSGDLCIATTTYC